jgi:hypothetical protein
MVKSDGFEKIAFYPICSGNLIHLDQNQFFEFHFHFEMFGYKIGAEFSSLIIEVFTKWDSLEIYSQNKKNMKRRQSQRFEVEKKDDFSHLKFANSGDDGALDEFEAFGAITKNNETENLKKLACKTNPNLNRVFLCSHLFQEDWNLLYF